MLTVGMDADTCRQALASAEAFPQVYAARRPPPQRRPRLRRRGPRRPARPRPPPALRGDRRDRPGLLPRPRATRGPGARLPRSDRAGSRDGQAADHPYTRGEDDTLATLSERAEGLDVILHCFSMPRRLAECVEHERWWFSFAGKRHLPQERGDRRCRAEGPRRPPARRDRRALPDPAGGPQGAQPPRLRRAHRAVRRGGARRLLRGARRAGRGQRRAPVRVVSTVSGELPVQPSLRRPAPVRRAPQPRPRPELPDRLEHPRRDRACRRARPRRRRPRDRRRPGRPLGAPRAATPRTSMSSSSTVRWRRRCATRWTLFGDRVSLHLGDAMTLEPRRAGARADQGRRQPPVRHRRGRDPAHDRGAADRDALGGDGPEGGWRATGRGSGQRCLRRAVRPCPARRRRARAAPVSRSVFHPVPNVDSVLVVLSRTGPAASPAVRAVVHAAFAHRRKALPRSLSLVPNAAGPSGRRRPASGLERRSRSSAIHPTREPSACRRRTSARWRSDWHDRARPPPRSTSACSSGRCARATAATSSSA